MRRLIAIFDVSTCQLVTYAGYMLLIISITPGRRQSKTLILSTNADQKSLETEFVIVICRPTGDKWQSKTLFLAILIRVRRLSSAFRLPPTGYVNGHEEKVVIFLCCRRNTNLMQRKPLKGVYAANIHVHVSGTLRVKTRNSRKQLLYLVQIVSRLAKNEPQHGEKSHSALCTSCHADIYIHTPDFQTFQKQIYGINSDKALSVSYFFFIYIFCMKHTLICIELHRIAESKRF